MVVSRSGFGGGSGQRNVEYGAALCRDILDATRPYTPLDSRSRVLDFGCGCGRVLRHWSGVHGTGVYGCDINPKMVDWCNEHLPFADVALNDRLMHQLYPFCRLGGPANILVMPELHSANIAAKLLPELGGGTAVGPLLLGLSHPVQIANMGATVSDLVNLAALSAHDAIR